MKKNGYIAPSTAVLTKEKKLALWSLVKGCFVDTPNGFGVVTRLVRGTPTKTYIYTVETYAKTLSIECTPTQEVKTDKGWKEIQDIKEGDVLFIKGEFVHTKMSAVKSVTRKNGKHLRMYYNIGMFGESKEYFANDFVVATV